MTDPTNPFVLGPSVPAPMVHLPAETVEKLREAYNHRTAFAANVIAAARAVVDAATPAASVPAADIPRVARSLSDLKPGQVVALTRRSIDRRRIGTIRSVGNGGAMLQLEGDDLRSQSAFSFDVGEWVILEDTTPAAEQADKGEAADTQPEGGKGCPCGRTLYGVCDRCSGTPTPPVGEPPCVTCGHERTDHHWVRGAFRYTCRVGCSCTGGFTPPTPAAEQADKGEAADTPRDDECDHALYTNTHRCTKCGEWVAPASPPEERPGGCGSCYACDPPTSMFQRMYVCATCGNKRCPASTNCLAWECSGSNDPRQVPVPLAPASPPEPLCRCGHDHDRHVDGVCFYPRCDCRVPVNDEAEAWPVWYHANIERLWELEGRERDEALFKAGFRAARGEDA